MHVPVNAVVLTGANAGDFSEMNTCNNSTVAVGNSCTISVTFQPVAVGIRTAQVQLSDDAPNSPQSISLTGSGGSVPAPVATLTPETLTFPATAQGALSAPMSISLTNSGNAPLHISVNGVVLAGTNPGDFSQTNTCSGATLAVADGCTIALTFQPTAVGARAATVLISDDAPASPQSASLFATGATGPVPAATFAPTNLSFPTTTQGAPSAPLSITLTNSGTAALHIPAGGVALTGTNPGDFSQTDTCNNSTLTVQESCVITVTFQPTTAGTRSARIQIADDAPNTPQSISLFGTGASSPVAAATLTPSSLVFPTTAQGALSASMTITLTNTGTAALHIATIGVALAGTNSGDFTQTNTCNGSTVAVGGSCAIAVTFQPIAAGIRAAQIQISDDAPGAPQEAALSGSGAAGPVPGVTMTPANLNFSTVSEGAPSAPMTITVTNSGGVALQIAASGVALTGTDAGDFSEADTCAGSTIVAGTSCAITVTFQPTAVGSRTAQIQISDNAAGAPQTAFLSGTGGAVPFLLGVLSAAGTSQTVTAGATAQYDLQITPQGGFTGIVSLACSGTLQNAVCTAPSALQVSGPSAVPFIVMVTTTAGSIIPVFRVPGTKSPSVRWTDWNKWCCTFALVFTLLTLWQRKHFVPMVGAKMRNAAAMSILLVVSVALVSCSGGSMASSLPASTSAGTPAGSYTITVTATVGGVSEPFNLTLIVQ
jgi:hypothetical protein